MSDKTENCPVCLYELKNHTVQDLIDCIQKLFKKNEDNHTETNPTKLILTGNAKNQEALSVITDLLKKSRLEKNRVKKLNQTKMSLSFSSNCF